jgi:hypothetical protein
VEGGSLLTRLSIGLRIGLLNGGPDVLDCEVELVVSAVHVLDDALKGRQSLDVIANGQEKPMRHVDED